MTGRENRMSGSLLDFIRARAVMDGWGDTRAWPLCGDLRRFPAVPGLHMEHELFMSSSKAPRVWVGAGWELQATRKISGTCRSLTLPRSLSASWWGERWGELALKMTKPQGNEEKIHIRWYQMEYLGWPRSTHVGEGSCLQGSHCSPWVVASSQASYPSSTTSSRCGNHMTQPCFWRERWNNIRGEQKSRASANPTPEKESAWKAKGTCLQKCFSNANEK